MFSAGIGAWTFDRGIVLTTHIDNFKVLTVNLLLNKFRSKNTAILKYARKFVFFFVAKNYTLTSNIPKTSWLILFLNLLQKTVQ